MKLITHLVGAVVIILAVLAYAAPIGPMPGFVIGGTPTAAPDTWPNTTDVHEIKLKVPGTLPRVVIIWVIQQQGELHVVGSPDSGWVKQLGNGGPVEMRLGDQTYPLNAERLTADTDSIITAYVDKYRPDYPDIVADFPAPEDAAGNFALFRLNRS
ncbi:MAG: hypothetical protein AB8B93_15015 [Pseudomonadales bacterium]